ERARRMCRQTRRVSAHRPGPLHAVAPTVALRLFFRLSRHIRRLHSFPTRRSSDLSGEYHAASAEARHLTDRIDRYRAGVVTPTQDRKSTRLNSSHLGISYAVFCLKKKKHETGLLYQNALP